MLFSMVAVPVRNPATMHKGSLSFTSQPAFAFSCFLKIAIQTGVKLYLLWICFVFA